VLERLAGAFLKFADPVEQDSGARLAVHSPFVADSRSRKKLRVATASYYHSPLFPSPAGRLWKVDGSLRQVDRELHPDT
jgi:hypothetical protein